MILESAAVVALVLLLALVLVWARSTGRAFVTEDERVAQNGVVDSLPTELPTWTSVAQAAPGTPSASAIVEPTAAVAQTRDHVVQSGETLMAIADQYGVSSAELKALNALEHPESLQVGQVLKVPAAAADAAGSSGQVLTAEPSQAPATSVAAAPPDTPTAAPPAEAGAEMVVGEAQTHTVESGDTLGGIAARYGVPLDDLLALNSDWLASLNQTLQVGDRVVVKGAQAATTTAEPAVAPTIAPLEPLSGPALPGVLPDDTAIQLSFRAPIALSPGDDAVITSETVLLRWASVGLLPAGVAYVVTLRDADAPPESAELAWVTTNATALRVPSAYRPALGSSRRIAWTVDVRRRGGRMADREGSVLSPEPATRAFTWAPGG